MPAQGMTVMSAEMRATTLSEAVGTTIKCVAELASTRCTAMLATTSSMVTREWSPRTACHWSGNACLAAPVTTAYSPTRPPPRMPLKTRSRGINCLAAPVAILSGLITGIFGGVIRDLLCNRVPLVFQKELYAVVSLGAACLYLLLLQWQVAAWLATAVTVTAGFMVRLLAIRYQWHLPRFHYNVPED